ncbi:MAG: hypothetical protein GY856_18055 [bacterium]|nr:hypothetical protein [bacterium]
MTLALLLAPAARADVFVMKLIPPPSDDKPTIEVNGVPGLILLFLSLLDALLRLAARLGLLLGAPLRRPPRRFLSTSADAHLS